MFFGLIYFSSRLGCLSSVLIHTGPFHRKIFNLGVKWLSSCTLSKYQILGPCLQSICQSNVWYNCSNDNTHCWSKKLSFLIIYTHRTCPFHIFKWIPFVYLLRVDQRISEYFQIFGICLQEHFQLRTLLYIFWGQVSAFLNVFKHARPFKTSTRIVASIVV